MNVQQAAHPKPAANGFGRRRGDKDTGTKLENKLQSGKLIPSKLINTGAMTGGKVGGHESPGDRLVYLAACLIGHHVEVQVKNGSIYFGIFHATNAEKDFGIILKMAYMIKGPLRGQKAIAESVSKSPSKTLIIPASELVQVIAKDVPLTRVELLNEVPCLTHQELMIDSSITQSRHVELERELEPWVPDEEDPQCPELENIFDGSWNRGWDQFETNEMLFGVKSTFDEELYTTKLERGPQMRDLEREAIRIAREIEGEETRDLHLAEERGVHLDDHSDVDEETRFSSVYRGKVVDASEFEEKEDLLSDSCNMETFGSSCSIIQSGKRNSGARVILSSSSSDLAHPLQSSVGVDLCSSSYSDRQLAAEPLSKNIHILDSDSRNHEHLLDGLTGESSNAKEPVEKQMVAKDSQLSKSENSESSLDGKKGGSAKGALSPNATSYAPSCPPSKGFVKTSSPAEPSEGLIMSKVHEGSQSVNSRGRPSSSASSSYDGASAASGPTSRGPALSPSSSVGSLSSEKSTLNPHAKEFKFNPNAKSFVPSQTPVRSPSPVTDGSFYYQANLSAIPQIHGMSFGIGIGPTFTDQQPVIFNQQITPIQSSQAYYQPNGPQYGQQMLLDHHRQVVYMPGYQPEMAYKGRE